MFRGVRDAEVQLYGTRVHMLTVRSGPGGEDHLEDLAQAWIDGDREKVLEELANRKPVPERGCPLKFEVHQLRKNGWTVLAIAKSMGVSVRTVVAHSSSIRYPRRRRKVDVQRIQNLRREGLTLKAIVEATGLSWGSVVRATRSRGKDESNESSGLG